MIENTHHWESVTKDIFKQFGKAPVTPVTVTAHLMIAIKRTIICNGLESKYKVYILVS